MVKKGPTGSPRNWGSGGKHQEEMRHKIGHKRKGGTPKKKKKRRKKGTLSLNLESLGGSTSSCEGVEKAHSCNRKWLKHIK